MLVSFIGTNYNLKKVSLLKERHFGQGSGEYRKSWDSGFFSAPSWSVEQFHRFKNDHLNVFSGLRFSSENTNCDSVSKSLRMKSQSNDLCEYLRSDFSQSVLER